MDSLGYSYNVRSKRSYATYWQCTVRPRGNACKATVIQRDGTFQAGANAHNHSSEPGAVTAAKIVKLVKEKALEDKFKPASVQCSFRAACSTGPRLFGERLVHVKHSFFAAEKKGE